MILTPGFQVLGNPGVRVIPSHRAGGLSWLVLDDFLTAEAAPLADPRTCEPGGGILDLTQTSGTFGISPAGTLVFSTGTGFTHGWITSATVARTAGYVLMTRALTFSTINQFINTTVWKRDNNIQTNVAGGQRAALVASAVGIAVADGTSVTFVIAANFASATAYDLAAILRSTGVIHAIRGGIYADWHPIWVSPTPLDANLYGVNSNLGYAGTMTRWGILDMVGSGYSIFNGDNGLASVYNAAPTQGTTFSHDANSKHYFTISSLPTSAGTEVIYRFRQQDASNYWRVKLTKDAGATCTITLDEIVANVATTRGTSASTVAAGDYIGILPYGTTIRVVEGAPSGAFSTRITYASATNFSTATAGEWTSISAGAAIANHSIYPEYLSGDAKTALDLMVA